MKKLITILLCVGMIGICSCSFIQKTETMPEQPTFTSRVRMTTTKATTKMTTITTTTEETTSSEETTEETTETTKVTPKNVYVAKGGKYHYNKKCKDLKKKKYSTMTYEKAIKAGYKPCTKCAK